MEELEPENLTVAQCQREVRKFLEERGWSPRDTEGRYYTVIHAMEELGEVARSITHLESRRAEVQEMRGAAVSTLEELADELADVYFHMLKLADAYGLELSEAFIHKLARNHAKFPLDQFEGMGF
ncbi:MAG: hypothetical protein HXX08_12055 [Chloroflexi bacterium]|uniref:MazG-like family protein n=1 Tax=Candidatus Chlorohelix allophototropha TaxID=3003348 RepID=A0A8T7M3P7_9CHLR|nr:hypothetical protein [Chloroflexota bacterium]WJW65975.1 MazG-like family protein [Chloroflexota bacterium L227-S17]